MVETMKPLLPLFASFLGLFQTFMYVLSSWFMLPRQVSAWDLNSRTASVLVCLVVYHSLRVQTLTIFNLLFLV